MKSNSNELLQGALDLLILRTLQTEERHGFGILKRIEQMSGEEIIVHQGSLYPALYRLERNGSIQSRTGTSENNRKAKYYSLTPKGTSLLQEKTATWKRFSKAISLILETA
jgi:PadR family transcriptional regulator PadR